MNIEITKRRLIIAIMLTNSLCIIMFLMEGCVPTLMLGFWLYLAGASTGMAIFRISAMDYVPYKDRGANVLIGIAVCLFTAFNIIKYVNRF